jgi:hypothetical protein
MAKQQEPTRYGHNPGSGSNEPKHGEKKEQRPDWVHRQGGDQSRPGDSPPVPEDIRPAAPSEASDEAQGKATRGAQVTANLPHLEGANQGPK